MPRRGQMQSIVVTLLITLIVLLSARAFALCWTADFNSDHAIHVLMANSLRLPHDLYYWGQTRLGSLCPILAHMLLRVLPIEPITAISIVQYVLLVVGYVSFASLLRYPLSRLILALIWFFPINLFSEVIQAAHPYGPQFALLGLAVVAVNQLRQKKQLSGWQSAVLVGMGTFCLGLSLWLSELSVILVLLLGRRIWLESHCLDQRAAQVLGAASAWHQRIFWSCLGIGLALIVCAKVFATSSYGIFGLNSWSKTQSVLAQMLQGMWGYLTFANGSWMTSIYVILALIVLVLGGLLLCRQFLSANSPIAQNVSEQPASRWHTIFFVNAGVSLVLLVNSEWVYLNQLSLRYFCVVYLSLWLGIITLFDRLDIRSCLAITHRRIGFIRLRNFGFAALFMMSILGAATLPAHVYSTQPIHSRYQQLQNVQQLGQAGIIGDYWAAYLLCSVNPRQLACTSHDQTTVRSKRSVPRVFDSPKIYLVKENWLTEFPPTIQQFGRTLQKQTEERQLSGYTFALYQLVQ